MARTVLAREVVKAFDDDEDIIEEEPVVTNDPQLEQEPDAQAEDTTEGAAVDSNEEQEAEAPVPSPAPKPAATKTTPKAMATKAKDPAVKKEVLQEATTEDIVTTDVVNALGALDKALTRMFDFYQEHYTSIKAENAKLREHNESLKKFFDAINAAVDTHHEQ